MRIKSLLLLLQFYINKLFGKRHTSVQFADLSFDFDLHWKHEFYYHQYIQHNKINGPICMDAWVISNLLQHNDIVLDAGANIGFTAALSKKAGAAKIHCFEPDPRLFKRLSNMCRGDQFKHYPVALSDINRTTKFYLSQKHNQGSTLSTVHVEKFTQLFDHNKHMVIQTKSIDSIFLDETFDFIKIDVEGEELNVLRGAEKTFNRHLPRIIYIEIFEEYFYKVYHFLKHYFPYAYQVICTHKGEGKLIKIESEELPNLSHKQFIIRPPSFIFSIENLQEYTKNWTPIAT